MIVSDKFNLLFVHIPKAGGGTIYNLIKQFDLNIEAIGTCHRPLTTELAEKYKTYFKFAVMRNPYTIQVSNYRWRLRGKNFPEGTPLADFVQGKVDKNACLSQSHYIKANENVLVDYIGKFEDLQGVMNTLSVECSFPRVDLRDYEKSHWIGDYDYRDYYDQPTKELVYKLCREDFELGGYDK